ncbi:RNA polymerase subunit sigma-54 [Deltaproteobacteria bacterium]|nr:RNA polymerase subunit sigma-54 [Deltaproteobacteria bacterium]
MPMQDCHDFLTAMPTGLAVCDRGGKLLMHNRRLSGIFGSGDNVALSETLAGIIEKIRKNPAEKGKDADEEYRKGSEVFAIRLHDSGKHLYLYFNEKEEDITLFDAIKKIDELNSESKELFRTCTNDTIWITDAEGNTIMAGKKDAENLGVTVGELEGKNVRDLEKEKVFYPSVTLKVMESGKMEVLLQRTRTGRHCVAIGIPYFNKNGELFKIVSSSRDISQQFKIGNLIASTENLWKSDRGSGYLQKFITANEQMLGILQIIKIVAAMDSTVLIEGETGSGKGVAAALIHQMSLRANNVFMQINCGAISPDLIHSELFGYTSGTFTGALKSGKKGLIEAASGGTLFLDEIGELLPDLQIKLLEVLHEKTIMRIGGRKKIPVDVRIIAATNKNLEEQVRQGTFREDLFYRLNVVPFHIPPLRKRKEDIPLLVKHFSRRMSKKCGSHKEFSQEAMGILQKYDWPGNIRELEHLVEKLYVTLQKKVIAEQDILDILPGIAMRNHPEAVGNIRIKRIIPMRLAADIAERKLIQLASEHCATEEEIARALGGSQSNISRIMKRHGIKIARGSAAYAQGN